MRLLVCGSRTWAARDRLRAVVDGVARQVEDLVLIEGGASGADRLAGELARERGWQHEAYPADWQRYGRAAGPRRNARMLRHGRPEPVLAFTDDLDGSRGTADMVRTVTKAAAAMSDTVMSWPVRRLQTESNLAPWHRPPNTLATIAARSRLPVASSRTWMVDNGSTGIRRPLTMIRSTWSRSGVATTTSPVGSTASTPSKISTSTP